MTTIPFGKICRGVKIEQTNKTEAEAIEQTDQTEAEPHRYTPDYNIIMPYLFVLSAQ